jgi:hypothetical protein
MNISVRKFAVLLFLCSGMLSGQSTGFVVGGEGIALFPAGELTKRFTQTFGYALSVREAHNNNPRWGGFVEYAVMDKENRDKLFIKRKDTLNAVERDLVFPLKDFEMAFEYIGLGVTANYSIISGSVIDLNGRVSFGIYNWKFTRDAYFDSIKVDTGSVTPKFKLIDVIRVPASQQHDWSGGFDIGLETDVVVFSPFIVSAGVRYKVILAELWPTLALDMENVSGLQTAQITVGLKYLIE